MHSQMLNRACLSLLLKPVTPLLIKSGDKGVMLLHPDRPKLMFVRTERADLGETVYLPGASLKGVVRAAAERVLRSLQQGLACDPLDHKNDCQDKMRQRGDQLSGERGGPERMAAVYKGSCRACRTFGSQALGARALFSDAYPPPDQADRTNQVEVRNSVAINRQTGGPAGGMLLDFEVVTAGAFRTQIHLTNYELWQIALIGMVLQDLHEGFVRLGSAKSRGLGRVSVQIEKLVADQRPLSGAQLGGVGALAPQWQEAYGLRAGDAMQTAAKPSVSALGQRFIYEGPAAQALVDALLTGPWQDFCAEAAR